jgi:putative efflux protein, MATE family
MADKHEMMRSGNIKKTMAWLAAPAVIGLVIQMLYGLVDSIFVGRGLGENGVIGLAALAIAFPVSHLLLSAASGVGVGGSSYISRGFGAADSARVKNGVGNMIIMAIAVGIICTIFGLAFLDPLLMLFGADEITLPFARGYMFWIILGCTFQILTVTMNAIVMAEGNSIYSMGMYAVSSLTNVILDYVFIFEYGWGVQGAAVATVFSQMLNVLILIFYLYKVSKLKFNLKWIKFNKSSFSEIGKVGASESIREGALVIMFIIVMFNVNLYGDESSVAIFGLINRIFGFVIIPALGIVQGMIPLIGYNYGAKNFDRIRKILKVSAVWAISISIVVGALTYIFTAELFELFMPGSPLIDEAVIAYWIADLSIPVIAFQIIGSAFMQALGKARASFILAMLRQLSIIPVLAVIPYFMGLMGVWVAFPIADTITTVITLAFVLHQLKFLKREEKLHKISASA